MGSTTAVAVYCGSSPGRQNAYQHAAHCASTPLLNHIESYSHVCTIALGKALAAAERQLVYGGGSKGIMGIVSGSVLGAGGNVVGVVPHAMLAAGGEGERVSENGSASVFVKLEEGRERVGAAHLCYAPLLNWILDGMGTNGYHTHYRSWCADFHIGRCGFDARAQGRNGPTFVRVRWTPRWLRHVRGDI